MRRSIGLCRSLQLRRPAARFSSWGRLTFCREGEHYLEDLLTAVVADLDDHGGGVPRDELVASRGSGESIGLWYSVGFEGLAMIAASGLDMAAWDALAKASGQPLCALLGGTVGPVKAYNSNGLGEEALELRGGRVRRA
jgi:hypothetical protein